MPKLYELGLLIVVLASSTAAHCAPIDDDLIARLDAASSSAAQLPHVQQMLQRLDDGPLDSVLRTRLLRVLARKSVFANPVAIRLMQRLADSPLDDDAVTAIASGLANNAHHTNDGARRITRVLLEHQTVRPLTRDTVLVLRYASDHDALSNRLAAIDVLAAVPPDHPQFTYARALIALALENRSDEVTRLRVIEAMSQRLNEAERRALWKHAAQDTSAKVRITAFEVLARPPLTPDVKKSLGFKLLEQMQATSFSTGMSRELVERAVVMLDALFRPHYHPKAVAVLIEQIAAHGSPHALSVLEDLRKQDRLDGEILDRLEAIAADHSNADIRDRLYRLAIPNMADESVVDALHAFEHARDPQDRMKAASVLREKYADSPVPMTVASAAERVMLNGHSERIRGAAAGLVVQGGEPFGVIEGKLIQAIVAHGNDEAIYQALIDLYGEDGLDDAVVRYAPDISLSNSFRAYLVTKLTESAAGTGTLSEPVAEALEAAARASTNYYYTAVVKRAFVAWGTDVPLIVHLKDRRVQIDALGILWLALIVFNTVLLVVALVSASTIPLAGARRSIKRTGLVVGVALIATVVAATLALATLGFLSHGSGPSPRVTVQVQIPMYIASVVFATVTWALFVTARRGRAALTPPIARPARVR